MPSRPRHAKPQRLKEKIGGGGATGPIRIDPALLARAEKAAAGIAAQVNFARSLAEPLADLAAAAQAIAAAPIGADLAEASERLFDAAHALRGEGGVWGYPLVTEIGTSLCRFIKGRAALTPRERAVVALHADGMRRVAQDRITGDGGPLGRQILAGLQAAVVKAAKAG